MGKDSMGLLLGVKDTLLLVDLGPDGDSGVDGVGDDTNVSVGAVLSTSKSQVSDDGSVGVLPISIVHVNRYRGIRRDHLGWNISSVLY